LLHGEAAGIQKLK